MKVAGIHLDGPEVQVQPVGAVVEAVAVEGKLPDLLRGQRFTATVLATSSSQVVINLQGIQVALSVVSGLKPGTELQVRVANVTPQLLLEVIPSSPRTLPQLPPLVLGQEVDVEIIEELPNGRVLVNVHGAVLEAEIPQGLPDGTRVHATVEQLQPQFVLHLLANAEQNWQSDAIRLLRSTAAHHLPAGESLQTLLQALATLVASPGQREVSVTAAKLYNLLKTLFQNTGPPNAEQLATFVRDGGLHYEAKLRRGAEQHSSEFAQIAESDVKGLLLQLTRDLEKAQTRQHALASSSGHNASEEQTTSLAPPTVQHRELLASLARHLEYIENQQAVNLLAHAQGEPYQLQIPLFTDQGMTTAFVAIEPHKKGHGETTDGGTEESRTGYHILFLLDLEGLGKTRIEARIGSKSLWGAFYMDQPASVILLQTELPAFRETLQALGYDDVLLIAKPLGQLSPEKRQKFDALAGSVPGSIHLLDVKA